MESRQNVAVGKTREAVHKAQAGDAIESCHHLGMERVVKIEYKGAIARESICEQRLARVEFMFGVVRPEALLPDRCRGDDGSVPIAVRRKIDDGKKIAVLAVAVACPGKEISSWRRI